ncbi:hypothetical protein NFF84_00435 [Proteus mirabilis]|uniref:tail fiber/spike domain-containing protein n=1 Tax=Proteus mirabilis TaxID=584 RepID=UPI00177B4497|nr:hypothetical protein [Proteus mirabilis]MDF7135350.1 hypothetical protein [Proteus mirabilis]MDF7246659.1 hypothetical protein [Proteus mirabilis]MDF7400181.1 hypothetical protein [Proteus mirabilis]MDF7405812.1 hypothetical protein [Proteus mirabilis]MDF7432256.1 hypothetical protein [Proteus mirabilis]
MTVSTELSHEEYVGNGVTTDFDFRFRIFESRHLIVVVADSEGNETTLKNGTDYTIVGAGSYHGGKVVLNKPLAQGWKILLERDLPVVQETDLRNQGKFFAEVHEDAFDYLTMLIQKALGTFSLSLRKPTYLSNYYDAKGNHIANLAPPKLGTDAANKDYVDNSIKDIDSKTLRVKDKPIPALPSAEQRRNKQLGFDNEGYPQLLDPAETGSLGYVLVDSFEKGAEITTRYQALHFANNGEYYRWDGELPKIVVSGSTPDSSGGTGAGKWISVGDSTLRSQRIFLNKNNKLSLSDYPSVLDYDFIYPNDETKDSTQGFLNALNDDSITDIWVPKGLYRVDDSIITRANTRVRFAKGASLLRLSKYSDNTSPVFILRGNNAESFGGSFITENNHPKGVVMAGHRDEFDPNNALWWRMHDPLIIGVKHSGNIGLNIVNAQKNIGNSSANYFGTISNPVIKNSDEGIVLNEIANGHTIISPQLYNCITSGIAMYGAYGNYITGGFLHYGSDGVYGLSLKNKRITDGHDSSNNQVDGFSVEPGGQSSKALFIDTGCRRNRINLMGNVAGGVTVLNDQNDYNTLYIDHSDKRSINTLIVKKSINILNTETYFHYKNGIKENSNVDFFKIKIPTGGHGLLLTCKLFAKNLSLDNTLPVISNFALRNRISLDVIQIDTHKPTSGSCGSISVTGVGNDILVSAKSYNNGTNTSYQNFSMSITIESSEDGMSGVMVSKM